MQRLDDLARRPVALGADHLQRPGDAETHLTGGFGLDDAVGEEGQQLARPEDRRRGGGNDRIGAHAKRQACAVENRRFEVLVEQVAALARAGVDHRPIVGIEPDHRQCDEMEVVGVGGQDAVGPG